MDGERGWGEGELGVLASGCATPAHLANLSSPRFGSSLLSSITANKPSPGHMIKQQHKKKKKSGKGKKGRMTFPFLRVLGRWRLPILDSMDILYCTNELSKNSLTSAFPYGKKICVL